MTENTEQWLIMAVVVQSVANAICLYSICKLVVTGRGAINRRESGEGNVAKFGS